SRSRRGFEPITTGPASSRRCAGRANAASFETSSWCAFATWGQTKRRRPLANSRKMNPSSARRGLISVVIPAFNEAAVIERSVTTILEILRRCAPEHELVIVDDGSSDGTFQKILALSQHEPAVRGICLSRNFGKESAILAGLQAARGVAAITI